MDSNLIALDELYKLLCEANLNDEQLLNIRGIKPCTEIDGIQYWNRDMVTTVIKVAQGKLLI